MHILTRLGAIYVSRALNDRLRVASARRGLLESLVAATGPQITPIKIEYNVGLDLDEFYCQDTCWSALAKVLFDLADYYTPTIPYDGEDGDHMVAARATVSAGVEDRLYNLEDNIEVEAARLARTEKAAQEAKDKRADKKVAKKKNK